MCRFVSRKLLVNIFYVEEQQIKKRRQGKHGGGGKTSGTLKNKSTYILKRKDTILILGGFLSFFLFDDFSFSMDISMDTSHLFVRLKVFALTKV